MGCIAASKLRETQLRFGRFDPFYPGDDIRKILGEGNTEALRSWLEQASRSSLGPIRGFARSIEQDMDAVMNALTLPWSNGPVEGYINKLKLLKRQMYGRAGIELLRR
ncbi:MAG: hypothetical protein DIU82_12335, partial [Bacillota bacterium]